MINSFKKMDWLNDGMDEQNIFKLFEINFFEKSIYHYHYKRSVNKRSNFVQIINCTILLISFFFKTSLIFLILLLYNYY